MSPTVGNTGQAAAAPENATKERSESSATKERSESLGTKESSESLGTKESSDSFTVRKPIRRNHSYNNLLYNLSSATDHFGEELGEDDAGSVMSVDSVSSELSTGPEYVSRRRGSCPPALAADQLAALDRKPDPLPVSEKQTKKLSQAMIWTWLTSSRPLPEDETVSEDALALRTASRTASKALRDTQAIPEASKVDIRHLQKLKYRKYLQDLNVTSPNNW